MQTLEDLSPLERAGAIAATSIAVLFGFYILIQQWAKYAYESMLESPKTECDIDTFVPEEPNKLKVVLAHKLRMGNRQANLTPIPLECVPSTHVEGLWVSYAEGTQPDATPLGKVIKKRGQTTVVVATIRMGFGHHRLAYSACSWALEEGYTTIFHDLLNIDSPESKLIHSVDELYSKFSRLASEFGGPIEKLWGKAMKQGDANALRIAALTAAHLQPLLNAYPKNTPLICTHQLVALVASAIGFTNVVNLVVDNYPQWFLVVPNTLNCTQGPVNYQSFLKFGVPPDNLQLAGHWCPHALVENIDEDCQRRILRAKDEATPLRLLIPVGGAGAQKKFIVGLVQALKEHVQERQVELLLNAGDHKHMKAAFVKVLDSCGLDYDLVDTTAGVYEFQEGLLSKRGKAKKGSSAVTLFAFDEYFPAVATTDILCRVADVLTCKPSELAFYPIPKLHIRRVGDHEADSARRAAEAGDGSLEAREIQDAITLIDLFLETPDWLEQMNEAIMANTTIGMYDGCKNAVHWAVEEG